MVKIVLLTINHFNRFITFTVFEKVSIEKTYEYIKGMVHLNFSLNET
jgi:hypothetical protein